MNNTMTAHEPINYLDSIINEEEKRCEYSHQWRNFTISRSGRFKSKNKKRDAVDKKLFDGSASGANPATETVSPAKSSEKKMEINRNYATAGGFKEKDKTSRRGASINPFTHNVSSGARVRDKKETYSSSYYETNL